MQKFVVSLLIAVFMAVGACAQTHSESLSWNLSSTSGVTSQSVYRAPCTGTITNGVCSQEGSYSKLASLSSTATSYTDSTVSALQKYVYYVTATCPTCSPTESNPSNKVAITVAADPQPNPPSGLSITALSINIRGANSTVGAAWTGTSTRYTLTDNNGRILMSGTSNPLNGVSTFSWTFKKVNVVTLTVCDPTQCISKFATA